MPHARRTPRPAGHQRLDPKREIVLHHVTDGPAKGWLHRTPGATSARTISRCALRCRADRKAKSTRTSIEAGLRRQRRVLRASRRRGRVPLDCEGPLWSRGKRATYSLCDALSFVVMERLGIEEVLLRPALPRVRVLSAPGRAAVAPRLRTPARGGRRPRPSVRTRFTYLLDSFDRSLDSAGSRSRELASHRSRAPLSSCPVSPEDSAACSVIPSLRPRPGGKRSFG